MTAQDIINILRLTRHPESGFYRETYRADYSIVNANNEKRNVSTAIYYLLADEEKSLFHRLHSDELWLFHIGQPLEIILIQGAELTTVILGNDIEKAEVPQIMIHANTWFAARLKNPKGFSLVTVTVSPGFDFSDFDLAIRKDLIQQFPHLKDTIEEYTS